ncbi:hypothetical protein ACFPM0_18000 [Pseudonocardia sulfidoxydans]|uniref:hypothetical protein n=1 Tax=Pseudonocardia sulfidoxydans TaxID=54011 RepID=UPI00360E59A9
MSQRTARNLTAAFRGRDDREVAPRSRACRSGPLHVIRRGGIAARRRGFAAGRADCPSDAADSPQAGRIARATPRACEPGPDIHDPRAAPDGAKSGWTGPNPGITGDCLEFAGTTFRLPSAVGDRPVVLADSHLT